MLTVLAGLVPILLLLGGVTAVRPRLGLHVTATVASIQAVVALAALAWLPPASLSVPVGPLPGGAVLVLDGLSAWFVLLVGVVGTACSAAMAASPGRTPAAVPPFLAAMLLCLLAGDGLTLILGFEAMTLAAWAALTTTRPDSGRDRAGAMLLLHAALGAVALALAVGAARAPDAQPAASMVLVLTLIGVAAKAGLVPLHLWLPPAHAAAPAPVSALMSAAMTKVALYVMCRVLLDWSGPSTPVWWGIPVIALGVASMVVGAMRATQEQDLKTLLACSTIENVGLVALGIGLALVFRGADLPSLAGLALLGALLHAAAHALAKTALFLAAGAIQDAARSRRLDRLGGLLGRMRLVGWASLLAAASLGALPPLLGFASEWLVLQALIAAPQRGALALQIALAVALALAALGAALAAAAMLRLVGIVFLGRPRSPAAAGAEDPPGAGAWAPLALGVLSVLLGLFPGAAAALLAPPIRARVGGAPPLAGWTALDAGHAAYHALPAAMALAAIAALLWWLARRAPAPPRLVAPAWACGEGPPPLHLLLGDPATQASAGALAQPLRRILGGSLLFAAERVRPAAPGSPLPARHAARWQDPLVRAAAVPARVVPWLAARAEWLQGLTIRRSLALVLATLTAVLVLLAVLEG